MITNTIAEFDSLVESHSREIFSYLFRMLQDIQDAEDALQDTFLRAFKGFPKLKDHANLRAWVYKIASNVAYTQLKYQKKRKKQRIEMDLEFIPDRTSPSLEFEIKEKFSFLIQNIERLPVKQRSALILRNYQDLSYAEVGRILECSPESARANVYQALKKLKSKFAEVNDE